MHGRQVYSAFGSFLLPVEHQDTFECICSLPDAEPAGQASSAQGLHRQLSSEGASVLRVARTGSLAHI